MHDTFKQKEWTFEHQFTGETFAVSFFHCSNNNALCAGFSLFIVEFSTKFAKTNNPIFDFSIFFFDFRMKRRCIQLNVIAENNFFIRNWKIEIEVENSNFLVDFNFI